MSHKLFFIFLFGIYSIAASAATTTELNAFYFSDDLSSTNNLKSSKSIYDVAILMTAEGRQTFSIGWSYAAVSSSDDRGVETSYSSTETGPKFTYMFGRDKCWYLGLTYNLSVKADFQDGIAEAEWRGTSTRLEFGYLPRVSNRLGVGVKLNYHAAKYDEQITNSSNLTQTSNEKTMIYPTFAMIYNF